MEILFSLDCGESSEVIVDDDRMGIGVVNCDRCGLPKGVLVHCKLDPLYSYGDYIVLNRAEEELQRIEDHVAHLKRERTNVGTRYEFLLYSSIMWHLCKAKVTEVREVGATFNPDEVIKWNNKNEKYYGQYRSLLHERFHGDRGGDYYPYPFVFKPPSPPDDNGVATNVQRNPALLDEEPEVELFCRYCGSQLGMDEHYCSVCGKKS